MEGGPPRFRPGFTCPALLRCQPCQVQFSPTGLSPYAVQLSRSVRLTFPDLLAGPTTPRTKSSVWALPTSLAATMGISFDFFSSAYLDVSVRRVLLHNPMYSDCDDRILLLSGFPIRNPPARRFFPAPRRLSRVRASFIAF